MNSANVLMGVALTVQISSVLPNISADMPNFTETLQQSFMN